MDLDSARDTLRTQHHAVLATRNPAGDPAMTPVLATVDDDGFVVISSRETAYKVRNLRQDPQAWLCSFPNDFFGTWLSLQGSAEIISLPDAMDGLISYYRSISGEHPDWDEYRTAMETERRCLIRISPTKVGPAQQG